MICAGLPSELNIKACWSRPKPHLLRLEIDCPPEGVFMQTFRPHDGAFMVYQDAMVLDPKHHRRGNAKRLVRNLVIAYDEHNITEVRTKANYTAGGYTWAILGARACYPELQQDLLAKCLDDRIRTGQIDARYRRKVMLILDEMKPTMMQDIAELEGPDGFKIGLALLYGHSWDAYWDLSNQDIRQYIREALDEDDDASSRLDHQDHG